MSPILRTPMVVAFLMVAIGIQSCDQFPTMREPSREWLLQKKRECAQAGEKFFAAVRAQGVGIAVDSELTRETFTYSPKLNTCVCAYQIVGSPNQRGHRIFDVYSNRELARFWWVNGIKFDVKAAAEFKAQYKDLFGTNPDWP